MIKAQRGRTLLLIFLIEKKLQMACGVALLMTSHRCKVAGMCPHSLHPQKKQHTNSPSGADCQSRIFRKQRPPVSSINMAASSTENKLKTENRQDVARVKTKKTSFLAYIKAWKMLPLRSSYFYIRINKYENLTSGATEVV